MIYNDTVYNYIMSTCACMHPFTHPFIHLPIRPYMWLMWLWDLVWLTLFSKGIHQMHCSFGRPLFAHQQQSCALGMVGDPRMSNQIDAGKEEQTSTVSCSWHRLSLGNIFDRDSMILWPNSMEPCCVWHRYDCMASVLPIFVVRWSWAAGNPTSWVSWVDSHKRP